MSHGNLFSKKRYKPYIDTIVQMGIAEQFYFLRFWERGPHIRLFIKGEETVLDKLLIENLSEHFHNYFDSKPSQRTDPNYPPNFPENYKWISNNTVQLIESAPDFYRFGGEEGATDSRKTISLILRDCFKCLQR